jgi:hypothetical protein
VELAGDDQGRQAVHAPGSTEWNHSRLGGILEFLEKLASMFKLSGEMPFIYQCAFGWYAAHYFLFAHKHGQIKYVRNLWQDRSIKTLRTFTPFTSKARLVAAQWPGKTRRTGASQQKINSGSKSARIGLIIQHNVLLRPGILRTARPYRRQR